MWRSILFGAFFTVAVSLALGNNVCGKAVADWPVRFVAGAAVLNLAIFILCCAQLAYPAVFAVLGVLIILWAKSHILRRFEHRMPCRVRGNYLAITKYLLILVFGLYFILYSFNAMAPEGQLRWRPGIT